MSKLRVMCNTSPIIGLVSINRLALLWQLFDEVILPEAVYNELCADSVHHQAEIQEVRECVSRGRLKVYQIKNADMIKALYGKFHYGELEVIVGAKELDISLAIIDERAARKMVSEFLVDTIGILGILTLSSQNKFMLRVPGVKRDLKYIAAEELTAGLSALLKQNDTADKEGLYRALVNQLGFTRMGDATYTKLDEALGLLRNINVDGSTISLKQQ